MEGNSLRGGTVPTRWRLRADGLELRGSRPDLILTSKLGHARRTAEMLQRRLAPSAHLIELDALTPGGGPGGLAELMRQSAEAGQDLRSSVCVFMIGHEGRLSDLVIELVGQRSHPVPHGGAVCVRGADFQDRDPADAVVSITATQLWTIKKTSFVLKLTRR